MALKQCIDCKYYGEPHTARCYECGKHNELILFEPKPQDTKPPVLQVCSKDLLSAKELAEELHNCNLDAWRDYKSMGKSAEMWHRFRMQIARDLLERVDVTKKGI